MLLLSLSNKKASKTRPCHESKFNKKVTRLHKKKKKHNAAQYLTDVGKSSEKKGKGDLSLVISAASVAMGNHPLVLVLGDRRHICTNIKPNRPSLLFISERGTAFKFPIWARKKKGSHSRSCYAVNYSSKGPRHSESSPEGDCK